MRVLLLVCLTSTLAHAQSAALDKLDPVAADFCKDCRRITTGSFAGIGIASVFERDPTGEVWLVVQTKTGTVAGLRFVVQSAGECGAGHCHIVENVIPALRAFSYRIGTTRVADIGLRLEIDGTNDVLEAEPRTSTPFQEVWFIACTKADAGAWACRTEAPQCDHATWGPTAEPTITSTCVQHLGRDAAVP
jgi:hypothetical protein